MTPWGEEKHAICVKHTIIISQDVDGNFISEDEAHYINAILNSSIVHSYIHSTFKTNGFSLKKSNLCIPKFDSSNRLHRRLVVLSKYATLGKMNTILQSFISEQESLENDLQMAYNEYTQVSQQVQVAKAKVQERTPAFTIVQCASVPQKPSSPKRMLGILASLILGFVSASAVVLFKNELKA